MSKPRISVNKLGEYVTASPTRRKSIVQNQKNPDNFIVARYTEARQAYIDFVVSKFDASIITNARESLTAKQTTSDFQANDKSSSIESLDCYNNITFPSIANFDISQFVGNGKIDIAGVDVSVNPDIIFRGTHKGKSIVGAIKFHIIKATLNEDARKTVATILHQFVEEIIRAEDEIAPVEFTLCIDIFSHKTESAPKSYKRKRTDVQAACEEYALWWDKV
ncbi:hypothetical protein GCM10028808_52860 [Spirosoma migulaei]